jgi:hypothetical protein
MIPDLTQAEAEQILAPHLPDLCEPIYAAWRGWDALSPAFRQPLTPRTRANWLHDMTVARAKATLDRAPTLTYTDQPGFLIVTVEGKLAVRYKKLDEDLGISGIRTSQFQHWSMQQALPGLDPLTHLVAGYTVSELGKLGAVEIVCSRGRRVLWHLEASSAAERVVDFPAPVESPEPQVRPIRRDKDRQGEGSRR